MASRSTLTLFVVGIAGLSLGVFVLPALVMPAPIEEAAVPLPIQHHTGTRPRRMAVAAPRPERKFARTVAPDFSLPDQNGVNHTLAEAKGKWVVLAFYPMDDSGGCTMQNKSYTAQQDAFAPLNAVIYTVSTQDVESKRAFVQHAALTHTLLADVGGKVAQSYGTFLGSFSDRITFYIRPNGTIAAVDDNVHVATAAQDSLDLLKRLQSATTSTKKQRTKTG